MILKLKNTNFTKTRSNSDINKIVISNKVSFGKKDFKFFLLAIKMLKNENFMHVP